MLDANVPTAAESHSNYVDALSRCGQLEGVGQLLRPNLRPESSQDDGRLPKRLGAARAELAEMRAAVERAHAQYSALQRWALLHVACCQCPRC